MIKKYIIIMKFFIILILSGCTVTINKYDHPDSVISNEEIRVWYNAQAGMIPELNRLWKNQALSAEERAKKAFEIRHNARMKARSMMKNKKEVRELEKRDKEKYGNPHGPTFESLVNKAKESGMSNDDAYESIIESSSRTDEGYNRKNGIYH